MATKFKVWIDNPAEGTNIQSYDDFASDSQRSVGFSVGNVASSIRVNSALRQSNLVAVALMNTLLPNSDLDLTSTVNEVSDELKGVFGGFASSQDITNLNDKLLPLIQENQSDIEGLDNTTKELENSITSLGQTVSKINPITYSNIAVSVTPTALSEYCVWDTEQKYGYSATITVSGLTTNSLIQNIVMTDTLLNSVACIVTTTTNGLIFYTEDATALSGTIYTLVVSEVE